ncbi:MAG TPA: extracellular solute-binding protein [Chthonomonadaceae bacterium]|nr:extracellular solute-binding protein [Chthonomonadaceae bacterium]
MRRGFILAIVLLLGALALSACNNNNNASSGGGGSQSNAGGGGGNPLVIAWAQWQPASELQELCADFTNETHIPVKVEQIPWPQYQDKIYNAWSAKSDTYDLIVGDSQWLGLGATQGHYVELTDWAKTNIKLDEMSPAALSEYGEYPAGSKRYYALPCESDGIGFAYRRDLFDDPTEKANFKAKYGYDLAPPKTWKELRDIAEFFTRPDKNLYGAGLFYSKDYDGITMGFDQVLWCYGGELHDASGKVEGVLNSPMAVDALKFYCQDLKKFTPPGSESYYFDQTMDAYGRGQVAMAEEWFAFMPGFIDPNGKNKNYLDKTDYFVSPAGPAGHYISLGGQGISISAYSKRQDDAKKFLAWFESADVQQKWAQKGGLTANKAVLASPQFLSYAPYNKTFAESQKYFRDFYNNPEYADLLNACQQHFNAVASGTEQPKQALDALAAEHTTILQKAGDLKASYRAQPDVLARRMETVSRRHARP